MHFSEVYSEYEVTYFIPKLTEEEKKLVEQKDESHLMTYFKHAILGENPDVPKEEMDKSESKSKFVLGSCIRNSYLLKTDEIEDEMKNETSNES